MNKPPISNVGSYDELDAGERELTISKLIVEIHDWLTAAGNDTTVEVWEFSSTRAYAADIADAARRLKLSDDLRLDALMVQRLSERAVGKAVRRAQAAGELGSLGTNSNERRDNAPTGRERPPSPQPYIGSGTTAKLIYQMTDGITDAQFNTALKAARESGRMSRAYIVRKLTEGRTGKRADTRRDLIESTRDLAEQLRRITVRLRTLQNDDRLERNKAEVAARIRYHLADAEGVCEELRRTLDKPTKDEGK